MRRPARLFACLLAAVSATSVFAAQAGAATCRDPRGFGPFLEDLKRDAIAQGVGASVVGSALANVSYDQSVVSHDHGQDVFTQSFDQFSARMVNASRLHKGANLIRQYGSLFDRIEEQYGVPPGIIVAVWGLETDFGAVNGSFPTLQALATLAFDCRRSDLFKAELFDALRIIQRGDLTAATMRGAWAGEIGQTQFMPSSYMKFATDFDGDGRRDLLHSVPDVLASTAAYFKGYGWQRGAGWEPGQPNFAVIKEWNKAEVYARTLALFATKLEAAVPR
jgi:lytic murein transglycosylase